VTDLFLFIGSRFTPAAYMTATRIQGILWSLSDVLLIFIFLKIIAVVKGDRCRRRLLGQFLLLWISAFLVLFLPFIDDSRGFFILESVIFGLQFAVLLYSVFADAGDLMAYFRAFMEKAGRR
jgi:hypothetical protein